MRSRAAVAVAIVSATAIVLSGCTSAPTPPEAAPATVSEQSFAVALAGPIAAWRGSPRSTSMAFEVPGTVVGASLAGGPVARAASGDAVIGSQPMTVDAAFHIGSMTKLFTAALVMRLEQDGILELSDTIDRWFPTAPNGSSITVRMLLQHESGLNELDMALVGVASNQQVIDDVFSRPPVAQPGASYQYLNAGYIILGRIAELASGRRYEDLVQSRFIEPLGLSSTYLDGYGSGPTAVTGYDLACASGTAGECLGKPSRPIPTSPSPSPQWTGAWSAGGMVSTARDQAVWIRTLVAGDVLDSAHRHEMAALTPLSSAYYRAAYKAAKITPTQLGEGTGLTSWAVPGLGTCLGHAGSIPGSNGVVAYCPDKALAIVVLNDLDPAGLTPGYPGLLAIAPVALSTLRGGL